MIQSKYRVLVAFSNILLAAGWLANASASNSNIPLRLVALQGQQAPGTSAAYSYIGFDPPVINNLGQVAFRATVGFSGSPIGQQSGLWFEAADNLNMAAMQETQPRVDFLDVPFAFNDQAKVVFQTSDGIWSVTADGRSPVARNGEAVPGYPGLKFSSVGRPTINNDGTIAFGDMTTCCSGGRVWTANGDGLTLVAGPGLYAGSDEYFGQYSVGAPKINAVRGITVSSGYGIWSNNQGQFELIATKGRPLPTLSGEVSIESIGFWGTNKLGDVLFNANVSDERSKDFGIWRYHNGQLRPVAIEGHPAPDFPSGVVFRTINRNSAEPIITGDSGDIAFEAILIGPGIDYTNSSSMWRLHDDVLQLVARAGMQAPGFGADVTFQTLDSLVMNGRGQIAFRALLNGIPPTGTTIPAGIFAEDAAGNFRLIVQKGDSIDVDPGSGIDIRVVNELSLLTTRSGTVSQPPFTFYRGPSDQPVAFNDLGQIAFKARFVDGSVGLFVSDPLNIPEPSTICLLTFAVILLTRRRLRKYPTNGRRSQVAA